MAESLEALLTNDPAKSATFLPHLDELEAGRAFFIHHALRSIEHNAEIEIIDEQVRGMAIGIWTGLEVKVRDLWILSAVNARLIREDCLANGEDDFSQRFLSTDRKTRLSIHHQDKASKAFHKYQSAQIGDYGPPSSPESQRARAVRPSPVFQSPKKAMEKRSDSANATPTKPRAIEELPTTSGAESWSDMDLQQSDSSQIVPKLSANAIEFRPFEPGLSVKQEITLPGKAEDQALVHKPSPNDWINFSLDGRDLFLYHAMTIICQDNDQDNADEYVQTVASSMWQELPRQTKRQWSDDTHLLCQMAKIDRDDLLSTKGSTTYSRRYRQDIMRLLAERNEGELKYLEPERDRMERQAERRRLRQQGRTFTPPSKRNTPTPPRQPPPPPAKSSEARENTPPPTPWALAQPQQQPTPPSESDAGWDAPRVQSQKSWSTKSASEATLVDDGGWDAPRKIPGRNPWATKPQQPTPAASNGWDTPRKIPGKNQWTASKSAERSQPAESDGWQTAARNSKKAKGVKW